MEWIEFSSISSAASSLAHEATTTDDGHTYDDGVIIKEATETTVGVKVYICTDCGDTYYEAILPTGTGANTSIYENGVITVWERGSVSSGWWSFYSIAADGYTLNKIDSYYYDYMDTTASDYMRDADSVYTDWTISISEEGFDVVYAAYTGDSAEASDIQWYKLTN